MSTQGTNYSLYEREDRQNSRQYNIVAGFPIIFFFSLIFQCTALERLRIEPVKFWWHQHTLQLSHFQRDSPKFWSKISHYPNFSSIFTDLLDTNLSLDLIMYIQFYQVCKNVPLLDQKSCFPCFQEFCRWFCNASGRLVGMHHYSWIYYTVNLEIFVVKIFSQSMAATKIKLVRIIIQ